MSGFEVLAIIASIFQVADLGGRLSVKLHTFGNQVAKADRSIQDISNDVALTCNILRELGDNLKKDQQSRLCSTNAVTTADGIVTECLKSFKELDAVLDGSMAKMGIGSSPHGKNRTVAVIERLKWPFLQPKMDLLRSNLERLKTTLLLMLNVIIYAKQVSKYAQPTSLQIALSILEGQRELIKGLAESKKAYDKKFEALEKAIAGLQITGGNTTQENSATDSSVSESINCEPIPKSQKGETIIQEHIPEVVQTNAITEEAEHYCQLVKALLSEIDDVQYKIEYDRRSRIRGDMITTHQREVEKLRTIHGDANLRRHLESIVSLVQIDGDDGDVYDGSPTSPTRTETKETEGGKQHGKDTPSMPTGPAAIPTSITVDSSASDSLSISPAQRFSSSRGHGRSAAPFEANDIESEFDVNSLLNEWTNLPPDEIQPPKPIKRRKSQELLPILPSPSDDRDACLRGDPRGLLSVFFSPSGDTVAYLYRDRAVICPVDERRRRDTARLNIASSPGRRWVSGKLSGSYASLHEHSLYHGSR
ncbi:MAG: hypothetical protein M1839_005288, partial [Geoglossum umbratile]